MKKKTIYAAIALDVSTSMSRLTREAQQTYNDTVESLLAESDSNTNVFISLVTFGSAVSVHTDLTKDKNALNYSYYASGNTKLFDGVGKCLEILEAANPTKDNAVLLICITDGEENNSIKYNAQQLNKIITEKERLINWTLVFNLPKGYKSRFTSQFNIEDKNCREWEVTTQGLEETNVINTRSISNYATSFKSGNLGAVSKNFYAQAQVDDTGINTSVLKKNLTKVTSDFQKLNVNNKQQIRDFVENQGLTYNKGCAFYELTKREIIQTTKDIIVEDHNNDLYIGSDARNMLGIPTNVYAKVKPSDHPQYKVYVQSSSVNRVVIPNTTVLYKK